MLPIKTTLDDVEALGAYLKGQVGWVPLERIKKTIDGKYTDNRKLEALKRIGLLERDGVNVKLSERGRKYATETDVHQRGLVLQAGLREVAIYVETIEWIHHSKVDDPSKTVIGNYWHDKHQAQLEGAQGAALTDAVIFFMRIADGAGLGSFTRGSRGRPDSYLKTDGAAIEGFVTASQVEKRENSVDVLGPSDVTPDQPKTPAADVDVNAPVVTVGTSPAVHVNIEIHIAADATADTVAEIFMNMRKYVLNNSTDTNEPARLH